MARRSVRSLPQRCPPVCRPLVSARPNGAACRSGGARWQTARGPHRPEVTRGM